jgi:hypothetical protein
MKTRPTLPCVIPLPIMADQACVGRGRRGHTHTYIHKKTHAYIRIYIHIYTYICTYMYVYLHTHTYAYIHTYVSHTTYIRMYHKGRPLAGLSRDVKRKYFLSLQYKHMAKTMGGLIRT